MPAVFQKRRSSKKIHLREHPTVASEKIRPYLHRGLFQGHRGGGRKNLPGIPNRSHDEHLVDNQQIDPAIILQLFAQQREYRVQLATVLRVLASLHFPVQKRFDHRKFS